MLRRMSAGSPVSIAEHFRRLSRVQRHVFWAAFLSWSLDSLDFFLLIMCRPAIAKEFNVPLSSVGNAVFLTLIFRPVGAFLFGLMADRLGRKPTLIINILCYSAVELSCAFAPSLAVLLVLRALFGIAMGGVWGVGAALTFETLPSEGRGVFSGLLQEGYAVGYLLAAALYGLLFNGIHLGGLNLPIGWRGLFIIGAAPALLVFFVERSVQESPAWVEARQRKAAQAVDAPPRPSVWAYAPTFLFLVVLMSAFCSFSHGTQDGYPSFLTRDRGFSAGLVGLLAVIYNIGSLTGGIVFGSLSERWGRKRAVITAALLAIPIVPLFAYGHSPVVLGIGAFLMQFMVQGAWGVVPVWLTELSPGPVRAILPGFAYQLGNLITSRNLVLQDKLADRFGSYSPVLAGTVVVVALVLAIVAAFGRESRGVELEAV